MTENLPDQSLERFGIGPCVVDGIFDDDEIRIADEQIGFDAKRAEQRAGAAEAGIDGCEQ